MNNQIPEDVVTLINAYEEAQRIERETKECEQQRLTEEVNAKGKAIVDEWIEKAFQNIPAWLRQYFISEATNLDYARVVNGWDHEKELTLTFKIPGLAQIQFRDNQWQSETNGWNRGYEDAEPYIHFGRDSYWRSSLDATLVAAKRVMEDHQSNLVQYEAEQARFFKRANEQAQMEERVEQRIREEKEIKQAAEQAEEQALFEALKNDPVAIHMLKAYVLLRDERSTFEQRLDEMGEEMYSIENHYSRKAADLRRQAEDLERKARDEQSRLQSDLDDAEAELKKMKRGW
jgi:hypothetical protein